MLLRGIRIARLASEDGHDGQEGCLSIFLCKMPMVSRNEVRNQRVLIPLCCRSQGIRYYRQQIRVIAYRGSLQKIEKFKRAGLSIAGSPPCPRPASGGQTPAARQLASQSWQPHRAKLGLGRRGGCSVAASTVKGEIVDTKTRNLLAGCGLQTGTSKTNSTFLHRQFPHLHSVLSATCHSQIILSIQAQAPAREQHL